MRVWKACGVDLRCTLPYTRATGAPLYVAFHTPYSTSSRRRRSRSTPYFIPLAIQTNGGGAFPDELRLNLRPASAGALAATARRPQSPELKPLTVLSDVTGRSIN
jgi:hypothetical protein